MDLMLSFPADSPPLAVIVAAKIGGVSVSADSSLPSGSLPTLLYSDGYFFTISTKGGSVLIEFS